MTHPILVPLTAAFLCTPLLGNVQDNEPTPQEKFEKKIHKEFVEYGNWSLDYDAVRKQAKEEGKLIFTYFSRSYSP